MRVYMYPINPFIKFLSLPNSGVVNGKCMFKPDEERRIFDYSSEEDSKEEA